MKEQHTQRIRSTTHDGISDLVCSSYSIVQILHSNGICSGLRDLVHLVVKELTILRLDDRLHGSTHDLTTVLIENSSLEKLDTTVQCSLTPETQRNTVRTLLLDHICHELGSDGKIVPVFV